MTRDDKVVYLPTRKKIFDKSHSIELSSCDRKGLTVRIPN